MAKRYVGLSAVAMALGFAFVGQPTVGPDPLSTPAAMRPVRPAAAPARLPASDEVVSVEPAPAQAVGEEANWEEAEYRRDKDYELNRGEAAVGISLEDMARARRGR
jgi:hypothetical protein